MRKVVLSAAVIAAFTITSCGGGASDVSVSNICDCMKLKKQYSSKDDAMEKLGEEKFKEIDTKCREFSESATDEEREKCND